LTDTLCIYICVKHFGMTNIKKRDISYRFPGEYQPRKRHEFLVPELAKNFSFFLRNPLRIFEKSLRLSDINQQHKIVTDCNYVRRLHNLVFRRLKIRPNMAYGNPHARRHSACVYDDIHM